jgi:hypothetical protein
VLGNNHPDTLNSMNNLAVTNGALGDLRGAHDLLELVVARCRQAFGDSHPNTLTARDSLALVRRQQREL